MSHLYADLDGLTVSTLGVWDALCVVVSLINHWLIVSGLLLQREDDPSDVHVAAMKKRRVSSSGPVFVSEGLGSSDHQQDLNEELKSTENLYLNI